MRIYVKCWRHLADGQIFIPERKTYHVKIISNQSVADRDIVLKKNLLMWNPTP